MLSEILVPESKRWNSSSKIVRMEAEECHVDDLSCFDCDNDDDDDDDDNTCVVKDTIFIKGEDPTNKTQFKGLHPVVSNYHSHR